MTEKLITLPAAAKKTGISSKSLRDAIDCDELEAYNMSNGSIRPRWFVKMSDVEKYVAGRLKRSTFYLDGDGNR